MFWLVLCSSVFFYSNDTFASTLPTIKFIAGGGYSGSSGSAICTSINSTYTYQYQQAQAGNSSVSVSGSDYVQTFLGAEVGWCKNTNGNLTQQVYEVRTCPQAGGHILQDGLMYCGSGAYVPPTCPAEGTKVDGAYTTTSTGETSCFTSPSGATCNVTNGSSISTTDPVSGTVTSWVTSGTYSSGTCTQSNTTAQPTQPTTQNVTPVNNPPKSAADCPGGSGFAQINNTAMCLPSGTTIKDTPTTTTSTGGSVTAQTTSTVTSTGGTTTTTTTTYKDASGNVTYSGTTTGTTPLNQASTGQGDKPGLGDAPTFDPTLPQESTFTTRSQGNPVFSTEVFSVTASCPAPITFTAMEKNFSIDFTPICDLAAIVRGIILMLSAIVAMRAVVTS